MDRYCRESMPADQVPCSSSLANDDESEFVADISRSLQKRAFPQFDRMRRNGQLCDVKIKCDGTYFMAHRCVLAATIPFFDVMFNAEFVEARNAEVEINDMAADVLGAVLDSVYTGSIALSVDNIHDLISAADFLQMEVLSAECSSFLEYRMAHANVLAIRHIARLHNNRKTVAAADRFLRKHFVAVAETDDFLKLGLQDLCELLNCDGLHVDSEEQVFEAAMRWLQHNESRRPDAVNVLSHVRMPLLDKTYLADQVATNTLLHHSISCRDLIDEAKDYHLIPERRNNLRTFKCKERFCSDIPGIIYACGGVGMNADCSLASKVEMFDPLANKWLAVNPMRSVRTRVGVAALHGLLYVIGGCNGEARLDRVEVYDPKRNQWTDAPPMRIHRSAVSVVTHHDAIYVLGGYDGQSSLDYVEIFNPISERWNFGPPLSAGRCAAAAVEVNGKIYVLGGHNSFVIFNTVECFDTEKGEWQAAPAMRQQRCRHAAVAHRGRIYVVGGYDGREFLRSTEVFEPEAGVWRAGPELNVRRARVAACVNGSLLYAIGGYDGESNICSMEMVDLDAADWTAGAGAPPPAWRLGPNMRLHEGGVGVGVVPVSPRKLCGLDAQRRPRVTRQPPPAPELAAD